jgi:hypothetical protein
MVTWWLALDLGGSQPEPPQVEAVFDNAAFDTAVNGGPKPQAVAEINQAAPAKVGMAASMLILGTRQSSMFPACKVIVPGCIGSDYYFPWNE